MGHELTQFREEVEFVEPCDGLHGVPDCARQRGHRGHCAAVLAGRCHRTLGCLRPMGHGGTCRVCRARPIEAFEVCRPIEVGEGALQELG